VIADESISWSRADQVALEIDQHSNVDVVDSDCTLISSHNLPTINASHWYTEHDTANITGNVAEGSQADKHHATGDRMTDNVNQGSATNAYSFGFHELDDLFDDLHSGNHTTSFL
jgi:hypothetical protein